MFMKKGNFQMLPETTNFKVLKGNLCNDSSILASFKKVNF